MSQLPADNAGVVAPPPIFFVVPLVAGLAAGRLRPVSVLPGRLRHLVDWPLLAAGVALSGWTVFTFHRAETPLDPRRPVRRIITSGPFRFSRNPSYSAFTLMYLGLSFLANSFWPLLLLPAAIAALQRGVIAREERYLNRKFGAEYTDYRERVRRWM